MTEIRYTERRTLRCRGPVEQADDEEVRGGALLVGDVVALVFTGPAGSAGQDSCSLRPAFHGSLRAWLLTREWRAARGYSAEGREETILDFAEGCRILIEHGVFSFPAPGGAS